MEITQNSEKTIIGWDTFNVGSKAHVNFSRHLQSRYLNKVSSQILHEFMDNLLQMVSVLQSPGGVILEKMQK